MLIEGFIIAIGMLIAHFLDGSEIFKSVLQLDGIYPDFLLAFIIFFSLRRGEFSGIWLGFFGGVLEDADPLGFAENIGGAVVGLHMLIYTITGYTLGRLNRIVDRDSMLPIAGMVLVTTILVRFFIWMMYGVVRDFNYNYGIFGTAVYTAFFSPIWFYALGFVYKFTSEDAS